MSTFQHTRGSPMIAIANDSLRFWPPLNFLLTTFLLSDRPTSSKHFVTFSFINNKQKAHQYDWQKDQASQHHKLSPLITNSLALTQCSRWNRCRGLTATPTHNNVLCQKLEWHGNQRKVEKKVMFSSSDVDHPCNGQSYDSSYHTAA